MIFNGIVKVILMAYLNLNLEKLLRSLTHFALSSSSPKNTTVVKLNISQTKGHIVTSSVIGDGLASIRDAVEPFSGVRLLH